VGKVAPAQVALLDIDRTPAEQNGLLCISLNLSIKELL